MPSFLGRGGGGYYLRGGWLPAGIPKNAKTVIIR